MQRSHFKRDLTTTFIGVLVLLLGATLGFGQQRQPDRRPDHSNLA